jgi:hypothetical protein
MEFRLLADENTSHRLVRACQELFPHFPIVHLAHWLEGGWLGLDDSALLLSCGEAGLVLVAFDRATLAWHAGQLNRAGQDHAGLILFRGLVRSSDYGGQARVLTRFWQQDGREWDWQNRIAYLPNRCHEEPATT